MKAVFLILRIPGTRFCRPSLRVVHPPHGDGCPDDRRMDRADSDDRGRCGASVLGVPRNLATHKTERLAP